MNCQPSLASNHDRPGWIALLLPLAAVGLAALVPILFFSVGCEAAGSIATMLGLIALPASVILAIVVAVRSWRDRPARRNRALGGMVLGLLLSAFCVLALIEVNRKTAALQQHLEEAARKSGPP